MKILQVIDSLHAGGAERVLIDTANLLKDDGQEVTVLTLLNRGELANQLHPSVPIIELNRSFKLDPAKVLDFMRIVNEHEVVHIHMRHVLHYLWFCSWFIKCRPKILFHDHFGDIEFNKHVPYYLRLLRNRITYIGVSQQLCDWAHDLVHVPREMVFFLGNIVIVDAKKKDHSLPKDGTLRLLVVSNFKRTKHIEFAIQVVAALAPHHDVHLDIYGRVSDASYRSELELLCTNLHVKQRITLVENETDIRSKLHLYDLALHTSNSETGPLVLIEYLSTHLPFLAFTTGEVSKQLKGEFPFFFLDHFDIAIWKQKVLELLGMDWNIMVSRFDSTFSAYYAKDAYAKKLLRIYLGSKESATHE